MAACNKSLNDSYFKLSFSRIVSSYKIHGRKSPLTRVPPGRLLQPRARRAGASIETTHQHPSSEPRLPGKQTPRQTHTDRDPRARNSRLGVHQRIQTYIQRSTALLPRTYTRSQSTSVPSPDARSSLQLRDRSPGTQPQGMAVVTR